MTASEIQPNTPVENANEDVRSIAGSYIEVSSQHTDRQDNRDLYITPPTYTPLASNGETTVEAEAIQDNKSTTNSRSLENDPSQQPSQMQAAKEPPNGHFSFYADDVEGSKEQTVESRHPSSSHEHNGASAAHNTTPLNSAPMSPTSSTPTDHPPHYFAGPVADAAMVHVRKCSILPHCSAVWLVKRKNFALSPLAATVLLKEGLLRPKDLELIIQTSGNKRDPSDPLSAITFAVYDTMSDVLLGLVEGPVEFGRQMSPVLAKHEAKQNGMPPDVRYSVRQVSAPKVRPGTARSTSSSLIEGENDRLLLQPDASSDVGWQHPLCYSDAQPTTESPAIKSAPRIAAKVAISSSKGVGRIIGAGLKAPMTFTHGIARGFHNVPKLYGEEVRQYENVVDIRSGLLVSAKSMGYGLGDGIKDFFVKPIEGAEKEGIVGFGKGFAKGVGNLVCKPTAGAAGIIGYSSVGLYKSIRSIHTPGKRDAEELVFKYGEAEYAKITDDTKSDVVKRWCQLMMRQK